MRLNFRRKESRREGQYSEEAELYPIRADVSEWLWHTLRASVLPELSEITAESFMSDLSSGEILCHLCKYIQRSMHDRQAHIKQDVLQTVQWRVPMEEIKIQKVSRKSAFSQAYARDNASRFLTFARAMGLGDSILFTSNGLVESQSPKCVLLALLEVIRRAAKIGALETVPQIIEFEQEIEAEEAEDARISEESLQDLRFGHDIIEEEEEDEEEEEEEVHEGGSRQEGQRPRLGVRRQSTNTTLPPVKALSLDALIKKIARQCTCTERYPVVKIGNGKYLFGPQQTKVFCRVLRNHVMVRVGGGWCQLHSYLAKCDPCRVHGNTGKRRQSADDIAGKVFHLGSAGNDGDSSDQPRVSNSVTSSSKEESSSRRRSPQKIGVQDLFAAMKFRGRAQSVSTAPSRRKATEQKALAKAPRHSDSCTSATPTTNEERPGKRASISSKSPSTASSGVKQSRKLSQTGIASLSSGASSKVCTSEQSSSLSSSSRPGEVRKRAASFGAASRRVSSSRPSSTASVDGGKPSGHGAQVKPSHAKSKQHRLSAPFALSTPRASSSSGCNSEEPSNSTASAAMRKRAVSFLGNISPSKSRIPVKSIGETTSDDQLSEKKPAGSSVLVEQHNCETTAGEAKEPAACSGGENDFSASSLTSIRRGTVGSVAFRNNQSVLNARNAVLQKLIKSTDEKAESQETEAGGSSGDPCNGTPSSSQSACQQESANTSTEDHPCNAGTKDKSRSVSSPKAGYQSGLERRRNTFSGKQNAGAVAARVAVLEKQRKVSVPGKAVPEKAVTSADESSTSAGGLVKERRCTFAGTRNGNGGLVAARREALRKAHAAQPANRSALLAMPGQSYNLPTLEDDVDDQASKQKVLGNSNEAHDSDSGKEKMPQKACNSALEKPNPSQQAASEQLEQKGGDVLSACRKRVSLPDTRPRRVSLPNQCSVDGLKAPVYGVSSSSTKLVDRSRASVARNENATAKRANDLPGERRGRYGLNPSEGSGSRHRSTSFGGRTGIRRPTTVVKPEQTSSSSLQANNRATTGLSKMAARAPAPSKESKIQTAKAESLPTTHRTRSNSMVNSRGRAAGHTSNPV